MDDFIVSILEALAGREFQVGSGGNPLQPLSEFSAPLYSAAVAIHTYAVRPITMIMLGIVVMLSLAQQSARLEGDRELGAKVISGLLLKVALVIAAVEAAPLILGAINETAEWIAGQASAVNGGVSFASGLPEGLEDKVRGADLIGKLVMIVVLLIPWLLVIGAGVVATVLIFMRYLQLYILFAFSSLPIAFLGNENTRSIGIGYLKRFATIAFSGVIIVVVLVMYQIVMTSVGTGGVAAYEPGSDPLGWIFSSYGAFIVGPMILIFMLLQANSLAKAIVGE